MVIIRNFINNILKVKHSHYKGDYIMNKKLKVSVLLMLLLFALFPLQNHVTLNSNMTLCCLSDRGETIIFY